MGLSLSARIALVVFLGLLATSIITVFVKWRHGDFTDEFRSNFPKYLSVVSVLLIALPFVAWKLVLLWLQKVLPRFPDVEESWNAGMAALQEHGIRLTSTPLFLVLGPRNSEEARALMESSNIDFDINGLPNGNPALQWFANHKSIYVVCQGASCVSMLTNAALREVPANDDYDATSLYDMTIDHVRQFNTANDLTVESSFEDLYDPSLNVDDLAALRKDEDSKLSGVDRVQLDETLRSVAREKLRYVCTLLRRYRQPSCGVNGIVSFIPASWIAISEEHASAIQQAAKQDARVVPATLGHRAHVAVVVGGMEKEKGFQELVKRFGPEVARRNRMGKGLPENWMEPSDEVMEALGRHVVGAFEDNVYPLFRNDHDLKETGNPRLYQLLCVSRLRIGDRLRRVLKNAYGAPREAASRALPILGCYFCATGKTEDRQAFARSVFKKLQSSANQTDWFPEVRRANERWVFLRDLLLVLNACCVAVLGYFLINRFWDR